MHQVVIFVAKYFIFLSIALTLWIFIQQPRPFKKIFALVGVLGGLLTVALAFVGSQLFYDPRPFVVGHYVPYFSHAADNGFPSDHTLLAGFLAFLCFRFSKKFGWLLLALAVLIGLARVQAGVHHLIDVGGALVFAGVGVGLAILVEQRLRRRAGKA